MFIVNYCKRNQIFITCPIYGFRGITQKPVNRADFMGIEGCLPSHIIQYFNFET